MRRSTAAQIMLVVFLVKSNSEPRQTPKPTIGLASASFVPNRFHASSTRRRPRSSVGTSLSWKHHPRIRLETKPSDDEVGVPPVSSEVIDMVEDESGIYNLDVETDDDEAEEHRYWSEEDEEEIQEEMMKILLPENTSLEEESEPKQNYNLSLENLDLLTESSDIAYFYLQNEIGLSEEAMWKFTFEAGSVLGMTGKTLRRKVDLLRRTMDLSDEDIRTLLERHPAILHLSADKNLAPTILFFVRALDLSKEDLRTIVVQLPSVLSYAMSTLKGKLNFFLKLMGYTPDELRVLVVSEPKLLTAGVKTGLMPRFHFLLKEMMIPVEKLRIIVQKNPRILLYSLNENLRPKLIFYFIMTLHMEPHHVLKLLLSYPQIVDYNLENHILPITRYFVSVLNLSGLEVRNILLKCPRVMTHSLHKIKHVVGYLRYELGMEAAQVKRVLYQAPQAIGLNTDNNLKNKVEFLRDELCLTNEQLRRVLAGMPTLIICGVDSNLRPKIEYLREKFGNNAADLRDTVLVLPTLLGYSLEKRIRPRMERLLEIGGHPSGITIGIPMKEDKFDSWLQARSIRLAKNPGFDIAQRKKKAGAKDSHPIAAVPQIEEKPPMKAEQNGRIIHWTRERRRPTE